MGKRQDEGFLMQEEKKTNKQQKPVVPDLHVDPEGPDVQRIDGFPQPGGEIHSVQSTPGTG